MATAVVEERELLKTISWFDGFVVALANPSFLITGLGGSAATLGGWGAVILWTVSVIVGALHNYIYSETAAMFPKLSGGIAIYAHEAWKRYCSFVGPIAAFGYWIGWSVVLSASGLVVGLLVQAQFYPSSAAAGSSWNHSGSFLGIPLYFSFPIALTVARDHRDLDVQRAGHAPRRLGRLRDRGVASDPARCLHVPPVHHGRLLDLEPAQQHRLLLTGDTGWTLVITWLYVMCWSSYGMECCATFAPEYNDPVRDTPMALRTAALFGVIVYSLLPLGAVGTFGDQNFSFGPNPPNNTVTFYATTFHDIIGAGTGIAIILLCAGIVLAMNTATADGSRALYGIARDDMTIKWFGKLNGRHVPANAMTLDALLNIFLLCSFGSDATGALKILIFSNLGYVLCHVFAMSGFLLLRRDQPNLPRPIKVGVAWVPIAAALVVFDSILLVVGGWNSGLAYVDTSKRTLVYGLLVLGIGVLLYIYRVVVQDKKPLKWRLVEPPAGGG